MSTKTRRNRFKDTGIDGLDVIVFDGKVKYIKVEGGKNFDLMGREFDKVLWKACRTLALEDGMTPAEAQSVYAIARHEILKRYDV